MRALQCCITAFQTRLKIKILKKKEEYKALVIDCGGGTTDLTSCIYDIEDNKITYQLDLKRYMLMVIFILEETILLIALCSI